MAYYRLDNQSSVSKNVSVEAHRSRLRSYDSYFEIMKPYLDEPDVRRALALRFSSFIYAVYPEYKDLAETAERRIRELGFRRPIKRVRNLRDRLSALIGVYAAIRLRRFLRSVQKRLQS
jgi:hypothetical protein